MSILETIFFVLFCIFSALTFISLGFLLVCLLGIRVAGKETSEEISKNLPLGKLATTAAIIFVAEIFIIAIWTHAANAPGSFPAVILVFFIVAIAAFAVWKTFKKTEDVEKEDGKGKDAAKAEDKANKKDKRKDSLVKRTVFGIWGGVGKFTLLAVGLFFTLSFLLLALGVIYSFIGSPGKRASANGLPESVGTQTVIPTGVPKDYIPVVFNNLTQTTLPLSKTGRYKFILEKAEVTCEIRCMKRMPNGTFSTIATYQFGGSAGMNNNFVTCDEIRVIATNTKSAKLFWWEE